MIMISCGAMTKVKGWLPSALLRISWKSMTPRVPGADPRMARTPTFTHMRWRSSGLRGIRPRLLTQARTKPENGNKRDDKADHQHEDDESRQLPIGAPVDSERGIEVLC